MTDTLTRQAKRSPRLRRTVIWVAAVAVLAGLAGYALVQGLPADPRRYPDPPGTFAVAGSSSSLDDAITSYGLRLPCEATDVGYRDDRPVIGDGGTMHVRLATTEKCLAKFLRDHGIAPSSLKRTSPTDGSFPFAEADRAAYADEFGWAFEPTRRYTWQVRALSPAVQLTVVTDELAGPGPVVYLVADRIQPL
jgi:hypothetical protein